MQPSMELRWFLQGTIPVEIEKWFNNAPVAPKDEGERYDGYLILPDHADLSVKLRNQQKFEIKKRIADFGIKALDTGEGRTEGRVEQWVKWSFSLEANSQGQPDTSELNGFWVVVCKLRRQIKYKVAEDGSVEAIDASTRVDQGCYLELTQIWARNKPWWSLGFEAFGEMDTVEHNLQLTLNHVLAERDFPPMEAAHSFAYPEWLQRVMRD
jgi:hypothetical protein